MKHIIKIILIFEDYIFDNLIIQILIIYFDTYLNVITPKCEIMEKLIKIDEKMNNKIMMMENDINTLKKNNKKLSEFISKIMPGFSLSDLDN